MARAKGPGGWKRRVSAGMLAVLGVGLAGCRPPEVEQPARQVGNGYNVLLITIDTLRPDHLGLYGYTRPTSPHIDAFGERATVFERAYTYWPKTRGSFVMMFTGRAPHHNGYSKKHPVLLGFNPTLAKVLKEAGYATTAVVDNANVAARYGYDRGFDSYRETWAEADLADEAKRARAITQAGVEYLSSESRDQPFFLWLHYVNPHAPYTPPSPFDTRFRDEASRAGPVLEPVDSFFGGVRREWAEPGKVLGHYVAQYDGEIAFVDEQVGQVLAAAAEQGGLERTIVILTSDHGESLGEHDYYFDHGANLFEPGLAIPLILAVPGGTPGRSQVLASTLDLLPTVLDALKISYPPGLEGHSLLPEVEGGSAVARARLFAQNERHMSAGWDGRFKVVASPTPSGRGFAFYDLQGDPGETRNVTRRQRHAFTRERRELELFLDRADREWPHTRELIGDTPSQPPPEGAACEQLQALGYVDRCS